MTEVSQAASLLGRKSVEARKQAVGQEKNSSVACRLGESLGGRPKGSGKKQKQKSEVKSWVFTSVSEGVLV